MKHNSEEKPFLDVANRPSILSPEAVQKLRELAEGPSTLKIELKAVPEWKDKDGLV